MTDKYIIVRDNFEIQGSYKTRAEAFAAAIKKGGVEFNTNTLRSGWLIVRVPA